MASADPEIGKTVVAAGIKTNYLEEGSGPPLVLIHGSGPGVTGWANWRFTIPVLARRFRVLAPDIAGFGYTERKAGVQYDLDFWVRHMVEFLDATGVDQADFVGNSFGGALTLAVATRFPRRVRRFALMGAAGTTFQLTPGLDYAWGYTPSIENMRTLVRSFVYDDSFVTDALVQSRHEASIRPGFQESFSSLFPAPRQRHIESLALPDETLKQIPHEVLVIHGREDRIVPLESSLKLHRLIPRSDLHVFGQCGHWTQIEKKDRFNALVDSFFTD